MACGIGTDEGDLLVEQSVRELGLFGEEAEARMDRLRAGLLGGGDNLVNDQVRLRRRRRPDGDGFIGHVDGEAVAVGLGIDDDGFDPHAGGRADNAHRHLAPIGDQDFFEHCGLLSGLSSARHP